MTAPSRPRVTLLRRAIRQPRKAIQVSLELLKGKLYVLFCRLRGIDFRTGKNLRIQGRLNVRGPGKVIFGNNVRVARTVTPWTYAPDAVIRVGDNTLLNGTRFACAREITIGRDCLLAEARIFDTDFHSTRADRMTDRAPVRVAPVVISDNVWIAENAGVLPGTTIGRNSVVGFGAVCTAKYPEDVIIVGNPARAVAPIPPITGAEQSPDVAPTGSDSC